jgi:hypothetical protein
MPEPEPIPEPKSDDAISDLKKRMAGADPYNPQPKK